MTRGASARTSSIIVGVIVAMTSVGVVASKPMRAKSRSRPQSQSAWLLTGVISADAAVRMMPLVVGFSGPANAASNSGSGTSASFCHCED